jgi:hypothetical protein
MNQPLMLMHPSVVKRVEKASTPAKNSKNILTNEGNNSKRGTVNLRKNYGLNMRYISLVCVLKGTEHLQSILDMVCICTFSWFVL